MPDIFLIFIFFNEPGIYTFLDLELDFFNLILRRGYLETTSQHSEQHMHLARVGAPSHAAHMGWVAVFMPSELTCRRNFVRRIP